MNKRHQVVHRKKDRKNSYIVKEEVDAIGEMGNISLGSSSTALSTLLMKEVSITTPRVLCTCI